MVLELRNGLYACAALYILPLLFALMLMVAVIRVSQASLKLCSTNNVHFLVKCRSSEDVDLYFNNRNRGIASRYLSWEHLLCSNTRFLLWTQHYRFASHRFA